MPVVAVLWPMQKLHEFHMWALDNPLLVGREPRSDDAMAGMWKIRNRERVLATVPSLVEHDDGVPSLIGTGRKKGDRSRRALHLAEDALDYDWTLSGP